MSAGYIIMCIGSQAQASSFGTANQGSKCSQGMYMAGHMWQLGTVYQFQVMWEGTAPRMCTFLP